MTIDDAAAIAGVQVASWQSTYMGVVEQEYIDALSVGERADAWVRRLSGVAGPTPVTLLAESASGTVVGFASGGAIRQPHPGYDAELHAIYLLHEAQRHGLGTQLVRAWAGQVVRRGFRAAVVRVLADNPARRFYEHLGARWLKDGELLIGERGYAEVWYGWDDLHVLAA